MQFQFETNAFYLTVIKKLFDVSHMWHCKKHIRLWSLIDDSCKWADTNKALMTALIETLVGASHIKEWDADCLQWECTSLIDEYVV